MELRYYSFMTLVIACYFDHICCLPTRPKAVECKGIKLTKIGCFQDNQQIPRPLPELVLTDRDNTSPVYSNIPIRWINWDNYMKGLICRCAAKALAKGYDKIGLQYYAECWSGPKSASARLGFARDGPSPHCVTFGSKKCKVGLDCVGEDHTNFVYDVQDKPSGSPTNKPTTKETTPKRTTKPTPTPSQTPSPTPSPSTPSPSPNPSTPSPTSSPTSRPSPTPSGSATSTAKPSSKPTSSGSSKPTSSGPSKPTSSGSSKPTSRPSPTPSGSATSTAKPSSKPTSSGPSKPTSSIPCQSTSCPGTGQQQQPCQYPPCLPQQPVAYPAVITMCPQLQCPTHCAPQCAVSCCNSFR